MNDQRIVVAHGTWNVQTGAKHTSRRKLPTKFSFEKPEDLNKLSEEVWQLIRDVLDLYETPVTGNTTIGQQEQPWHPGPFTRP
jgi:hypothetical protein